MDDLIQYCLQELAFEGDYGCDPERLRKIVSDFYRSTDESISQNLDETFQRFVWKTLSRVPYVKVGLLPDGQRTDIYVPPQPRKKDGHTQGSRLLRGLEEIPIPNSSSMDPSSYGGRLRIAIDSDRCFVAITGSHTRHSKLTPMVYATLQLISRSRDEGTSVLEIGQRLGTDQKTCYHLVKQLLELDLIMKLRRGGVSQNFCIHKYFYERSPLWKKIRAEAGDTEEAVEANVDGPAGAELSFSPITTIHLSNIALLRQRIITLLKHSAGQTQPYLNLCVKIGYVPKCRSDRRFFINRLLELVREGTVEFLGAATSTIDKKFVHLAPESKAGSAKGAALNTMDEDAMINSLVADADEELPIDTLSTTKTLHRQMVEHIQASGTTGITLNELSDRLAAFDKRVLGLLLSRLQRQSTSCLADLCIVQTSEFHFREKRFRYFTLSNAIELSSTLADFELPKELPSRDDVAAAGGFKRYGGQEFYEVNSALERQLSKWDGRATSLRGISSTPMSKISKPTKEKVKKEKKWVNPVLPDGTRKRGRPSKKKNTGTTSYGPIGTEAVGESVVSAPNVDRLEEFHEIANLPASSSASRKRNRGDECDNASPQLPEDVDILQSDKSKVLQDESNHEPSIVLEVSTDISKVPPKRGRGRPPKKKRKMSAQDLQDAKDNTNDPPACITETDDDGSVLVETSQMSLIINPEVSETQKGEAEENTAVDITGDDRRIQPGPLSMSRLEAMIPLDESSLSIDDSRTPVKQPSRNLTALRRENELLHLVELAGGIVNTSATEFFDKYRDVKEALVKAGETASAPVSATMDRRTLTYTIDKLQTSGKLKMLTTNTTASNGSQRIAKIIFLPSLSEDDVRTFIASLGFQSPITLGSGAKSRTDRDAKKTIPIPQAEEIGNPIVQARRLLNISDDEERICQLLTQDDKVVRQVFLLERETVSQLYGYLPGKASRARNLHLYVSKLFENRSTSSSIVSSDSRIIDWTLLERDLPLELYCMCFKAHHFNSDLLGSLRSLDRRSMLLHAIPSEWAHALHIGRSKSRSQIFSLLDFLRRLKIVVPLEECLLDEPHTITFCDSLNRPRAFRTGSNFRRTSNYSLQPKFWKFNISAPIYLYAAKQMPIPRLREARLSTEEETRIFWNELKSASSDEYSIQMMQQATITDEQPDETAANILRRSVSWMTEYKLTGFQKQYLERSISHILSNKPVQELESGPPLLRRLCEVSSAPLSTVQEFVELRRNQHLRLVEKEKAIASAASLKDSQRRAARNNLLRDVVNASDARSQAWDELMSRVQVHCGPLRNPTSSRLRQLHQNFVEGTVVQADYLWEQQVIDAISLSSDRVGELALQPSRVFRHKEQQDHAAIPPEAELSTETENQTPGPGRAISALIDLQRSMSLQACGSALKKSRSRKKSKEHESEEKGKVTHRRQRFKWTPDFDELVKDAQVIIASRCGDRRLDYGALDQVFPAIPRDSVRRRLSVLREQPGVDAYLQRLQSEWTLLWEKKRGTVTLPDDDPWHPVEFDLVKHIEYLRSHINKAAIRVGVAVGSKLGEQYTLPASPQTLNQAYDLDERVSAHASPSLLLDSSLTEESRERLFGELGLVIPAAKATHTASSNLEGLAESALKMVIGTPDDRYEPSAASGILHKVGDSLVESATEALLSKNTFSKLVRDPTKMSPGRTVKISEPNQNALGGAFSNTLFFDAIQCEDTFTMEDDCEQDWPLVATEGETASILQLISDHVVDFAIDCTRAREARQRVENSRKADDDDIELALKIRLTGNKLIMEDDAQSPISIAVDRSDHGRHGLTVAGDLACCKRSGLGIVDCARCLEEVQSQLLAGLDNDDAKQYVQTIIETVSSRGSSAISRDELHATLPYISSQTMDAVVHSLHTMPTPLLHIVGYRDPLILSSKHVDQWSVSTRRTGENLVKVFPRRWLDIWGRCLPEIWKLALHAVMGELLLRPGISQIALQRHMSHVYDRAELNEVLSYLVAKDLIWHRTTFPLPCIECLDPEGEENVFWFTNEDKHWYNI